MKKEHARILRQGVYSIVAIGLTGALHYGVQSLTIIKQWDFTIDPNLSPSQATAITKKFLYESSKTTNHHALCATMRTHFPCIDTIAVHIYAPGHAHCTITALLPRYVINNLLVLTPNDTLMPKGWYQDYVCTSLPSITTTQPVAPGHGPAGLCALANRLPSATTQHYDIVWNNAIETRLTNKKDTNFSIICNANCIPTALMRKQCEDIYTTMKSNECGKKRLSAALHADVRFVDQIVIHAEQGGKAHG